MNELTMGQVSGNAAEIYERVFVPALFGQWPPRLCDAAGIRAGDAVLDVACGTGTLAREAKARAGDGGSVHGIDVNEGMLAVARSVTPGIDWRQGVAESLPFEDAVFDVVASQFGLMFFDDRPRAVTEMVRVLKPGGRLVVAVWDSVDNTPGYAAVAALLDRLFGTEIGDATRSPFVMGDPAVLERLVSVQGLRDVSVETLSGMVRFPTVAHWMRTEIKGWVLADVLDDDQFDLLLAEAPAALAEFVQDDGTVAFDSPAIVATATRA